MMSKTKKMTKAIERPFPPKVLADARRIVGQYHVLLWQEDGRWYGRGLELPNVFGDGLTSAKCVACTLDGLTATVAHLLETGAQPPAPARDGTRNEQVNVRLSAEEKLGFESAAKARADSRACPISCGPLRSGIWRVAAQAKTRSAFAAMLRMGIGPRAQSSDTLRSTGVTPYQVCFGPVSYSLCEAIFWMHNRGRPQWSQQGRPHHKRR